MITILKNATLIIDGQDKIDKANMVIKDGLIHEFSSVDVTLKYPTATQIDLEGHYILPGFIDTHIHGANNHDSVDGQQASIDAISYNVIKDGCTAFLASFTVISHNEMLDVLRRYRDITQPQNGAIFLGIHEEGPYLSKEYKALMDERYLRDPSTCELDEMIEASNNKIVSMTIAPELDGMAVFIDHLKEKGITVMIGHSGAKSQDVAMALAHGADGFTHLYNANSQHLHRDPGVVTGAFLDNDSYCELICDGYHIHDDVIKMSYKYLGPNRIVIITDAMLAKGMPDGEYVFSNLSCQKKGTHVWVSATGRRAGSAFGMIDAVKYLLKTVNCSLNDIVQMACVNPARLAKANNKGKLKIDMDADLCVLDKNMDVKMTIVGGQIVYQK